MRSGRGGGHWGGRARTWTASAWLVAVALLGCDGPSGTIELPELLPARDAGEEEVVIPEGAILCERDRECDDGIDCTRDFCVKGRYCRSAADSTSCDDDIFCNGFERCDPLSGCLDVGPQRCNDEDVCTIDYCDESRKACAHDPRDFDDDGEVDWHCLGGTDCNDFDGTQARAAAEICGDGVDNDCDDAIDEMSCGQVDHDTCDDALDVSAGGRFELDLAGALADYVFDCRPPNEPIGRDVALTFTTEKPHDVILTASGLLGDGSEGTASIALRRDCVDMDSEIECSDGFPGQVRVRALPPGRYYAIARSAQTSRIVIEARFDDATEPPPNATCESPLDISGGGHFEGDFTDVGDDTALPCSPFPSSDLFYSFTLAEEQDVEISALSVTGQRMQVGVRGSCDDPDTTLRCLSAAPARGRLHQLAAGTYYVVLEGPSSREVDFNLDVAILPPTPPPAGGGCSNPIDLPLSTEQTGSLTNLQDFVPVDECGCKAEESELGCGSFLPDLVYRVEVEEPSDLQLRINGGGASIAYHLRSSCEEIESERDCGAGTFTESRTRNLLPGTYYLVLESAESSSFTVAVDSLPPTVPVEVTGNDTCASAYDVPATGGLFAGNTDEVFDDYQSMLCPGAEFSNDAVFRLLVPSRSRVTASLDAPFDTVMHLYRDLGEGPAASCAQPDIACDDDSGLRNRSSLLDVLLDSGVYYFVIDGFNENNEGEYLFDVNLSLP